MSKDNARLISQNAGQVRGVMENPDEEGDSGGYGVITIGVPGVSGTPASIRQFAVIFGKAGGTIKAGDVFKVQSMDRREGRLGVDGEVAATVLYSVDIRGVLKTDWKAVGTQGTVTVLKISEQFVTLKIDNALLNNAADSSGRSQVLVSGTFSYVPEPR